MTGRNGVGRYDADVLVVGLGALGSAASWQLARRGGSVIGLERFALGHDRGASHGDSRIIRLSYHSPGYVRRAAAAYRAWSELEQDAGTALVLRCGGVDVFPPGAAIPPEDYLAAMTAEGVPFERLDAAGARHRWPELAVPDGALVLHQAQTGIVPAALGTATMQRLAAAHGADLRPHTRVERLTETADGVQVSCSGGVRLRARSVVVTADAWTNQVLAGLDVRLPLTLTKEHVVHYAVDDDGRHHPGAFPVWIWMDDPSYYGFPCYGEATVKVGQDCGGRPVDPDTRSFDADPEYVRRMTRFVREAVPRAGDAVRVTTCLYTLTPDRDLVAGVLPDHPRVVVGLGAAHGFKFAPWLGGVLADLATTGGTGPGVDGEDVDGLEPSQPALTEPDAPVRWLV
jgi:sarcosine oxidase